MLGLQCLHMIVATLTSLLSDASTFFTKNVKIVTLNVPVWLLLVWAVGLALAVILIVLLVVVNSKDKKLKKMAKEAKEKELAEVNAKAATEEENEENVIVEETAAENTVVENTNESVDEPVEETETKETVEETAEDTTDTVTTETVEEIETTEPVETAEEETTEETAEPVEEIKEIETVDETAVAADDVDSSDDNTNENKKEAEDNSMEEHEEQVAKVAVGKLNYYLTESGYYFSLDANNGQELFVSYSYTTLDGAMKGFETFANAVKDGKFIVSQDKNNRFKYILNKKYQGPNYKTKAACENSIASVKKFAQSYKINVIEEDEETQKAFAAYLEELKKSRVVDMEAIAKEEAETPKSGSFEIEEADGGYRFYLYANNKQILYSSNIYASAVSAKNGIDAFKKAVYGGVVVIEKDKFGNYRYILRNSTTVTYAGESFTNEASAKSQFESVKRFVKSATIVPYKKKVEETAE